jgi:hypothetical protein
MASRRITAAASTAAILVVIVFFVAVPVVWGLLDWFPGLKTSRPSLPAADFGNILASRLALLAGGMIAILWCCYVQALVWACFVPCLLPLLWMWLWNLELKSDQDPELRFLSDANSFVLLAIALLAVRWRAVAALGLPIIALAGLSGAQAIVDSNTAFAWSISLATFAPLVVALSIGFVGQPRRIITAVSLALYGFLQAPAYYAAVAKTRSLADDIVLGLLAILKFLVVCFLAFAMGTYQKR